MLSSSDVMYDNFDFIYRSAFKHPQNDVKLLSKNNLNEKYSIYYLNLFKETIEMYEKVHDFENHDHHEKLFKLQPVKTCIDLIAKATTYKFRHELLHLSAENCKELSQRHFNQIVTVLESSTEESSTNFYREIYKNIENAIDPSQKKEIEQLIGEYVVEYDRSAQSSDSDYREVKLVMRIISLINQKDFDIYLLIHCLSGFLPHLGIKNPCIESLKIINNQISTQFEYSSLRDDSMEAVIKKVILLLMRWKIKIETDNSSNLISQQAVEIIGKLDNTPVTRMLSKQVNELKKEVTVLKQNQKYTEDFLKEKYPDFNIMTPEQKEKKIGKVIQNSPLKDHQEIGIRKSEFELKEKKVLKTIDEIFNYSKESFSNEWLDEILKGSINKDSSLEKFYFSFIPCFEKSDDALKEKSLIEKINILFSPEQSFLALENSFRRLYNRAESINESKSYFAACFSDNVDINPAILLWISTLCYASYKREMRLILSKEKRAQFKKNYLSDSLALETWMKLRSAFPAMSKI